MPCETSSINGDEIFNYSYLSDSDVISQEVLETNHTTTINIYKLNYVAISWCFLCFAVFMIVITWLLRGKRVQTLKPPILVIYYLSKTSYKPEHAQLCKTLINKEDYDVNYMHADIRFSLFLCACLAGNAELISFMLNKGANIHATSSDNDSAFYLCCSSFSTENSDFIALDILLSAGSDINSQNINGFTALHLACSRGHLLLVKYLLLNGANPAIPTFNEVLPHHLAITNGHTDIAVFILNKIEKIEVE